MANRGVPGHASHTTPGGRLNCKLTYIMTLRATLRRQRREIRLYRTLALVLAGALCFQLFR